MIAMEKAIAERLGYLQRYKVVLTTDVSLAVDIALYIMLHFCDSCGTAGPLGSVPGTWTH